MDDPPSRCQFLLCNKKLSLIKVQCKCSLYLCSKHLPSDVHNCTFDYKGYAKRKLRESNPVVVANKLQKI